MVTKFEKKIEKGQLERKENLESITNDGKRYANRSELSVMSAVAVTFVKFRFKTFM